MNKKHKNTRKGFTLLEILLVIAAIGILAAIVLVAINPNKQIEAARNAKRRADINTITKAIQQYSIDNNGQYPTGIETGAKAICRGGAPVGCVDLSVLSPNYIASIPDPDSNYYYVRRSNNSIEVSHPRDTIWNIGGNPSLDLNFASNKSLIDSVSGNNLVTFTRASSGTYVGSDGVLQTATTNEPRFDHNPTTGESLGLLVEEARTNSIRNNTMQGAVAGTPGTLPTNWAVVGNAALSREIVGIGVENGISYIDVRFYGTVASAVAPEVSIQFEANTFIAAALSQTWTASSYLRVVGGSLNNVLSGEIFIICFSSSGALSEASSSTLNYSTLTGALQAGRVSHTRTLTSAATASVASRVDINFASGGVPADITLRIGLPQLEQGASATSVIPTTTAAATRSADVASVNTLNPWYNATEGTFYVEGAGQIGRHLMSVDHGTVSNRIQISVGSNAAFEFYTIVAGAATNSFSGASIPSAAGIVGRGALALASGSVNAAISGTLPFGANKTGALPSGLTQMRIGNVGNTNYLSGTIRRLTYFQQRLSNANLQRITQ